MRMSKSRCKGVDLAVYSSLHNDRSVLARNSEGRASFSPPNMGLVFETFIYIYLCLHLIVLDIISPASPFRFLPISIFVLWSSRNPSLPIVNTRYVFFEILQQSPECDSAHQFYFFPFAQSFSCSQIPRPSKFLAPICNGSRFIYICSYFHPFFGH